MQTEDWHVPSKRRRWSGPSCGTILDNVQRDPVNLQWTPGKKNSMRWLQQKESAPGPDVLAYSVYRCAGEIGAQQRFDAFKCTSSMELLFHQASQPAQWCSFPNPAQPIDDQGWIVRSPEALGPLTLCKCECKVLTTALGFRLGQYSISCVHQHFPD